MKEINRIYTKNKIEKFGVNNTPKLNKYFTSILKLTIALALFLMAALFISGAGITVENGDLNVSLIEMFLKMQHEWKVHGSIQTSNTCTHRS